MATTSKSIGQSGSTLRGESIEQFPTKLKQFCRAFGLPTRQRCLQGNREEQVHTFVWRPSPLTLALASAGGVLVLGWLLFAYTNPAFAISAYTLIGLCF